MTWPVGGFNPTQNYSANWIGSFPQVGGQNKKIFETTT